MFFVKVNKLDDFQTILKTCLKNKKIPCLIPYNNNDTLFKILEEECYNLNFIHYFNMNNDNVLTTTSKSIFQINLPVQDFKPFIHCAFHRFNSFQKFMRYYSKVSSQAFNTSAYYNNGSFILSIATLTSGSGHRKLLGMISNRDDYIRKIRNNKILYCNMPTELYFDRYVHKYNTSKWYCLKKKEETFSLGYDQKNLQFTIKGKYHLFFTKNNILFKKDTSCV